MFDKLVIVKQDLMEGKSREHIASMLDECIYRTAGYMRANQKHSNKVTQKEIEEKRKDIPSYDIRKNRWNQDDIKTEARKRFEKGIV